MPSKVFYTYNKFYTYKFLIISLVVGILGFIINRPFLPIRRETKTSLGYPKDSLLNFTELTGEYGYSSDEHRVVTEDGYILTMFRIISAKNCRRKKRFPPVLLMHGLLQSSDSFIDSGPSSGLAYLISDACYDLWIGNYRGNYYARSHVKLNPDKDAKFWQFDIEEIGTYDLPAMIDYILMYTGAKKLNYIGFSQGTSTFLVMCSERPEYCNKIQILIGIAPASRHFNTQSVMYRFLTATVAKFESRLTRYGIGEVFAKGDLAQELVAFFCQFSDMTVKMCELVLNLFDHVVEFHVGTRTNDTTKIIFGHFPAGTSLHNLAQYGHSMRSERFTKFDYGIEENLKRYGSEDPPDYNLDAVTAPALFIYGKNDGLVDTKDVAWLITKMPNVLEAMEVNDPLWTHLDMTYSRHINEAILPKINEYLHKYTWS